MFIKGAPHYGLVEVIDDNQGGKKVYYKSENGSNFTPHEGLNEGSFRSSKVLNGPGRSLMGPDGP